MKTFEVGHEYEADDPGLSPIKVIRRTAKSIIVNNGQNTWMMRIRADDETEYVVDTSVPRKWREMFTFKAKWEV